MRTVFFSSFWKGLWFIFLPAFFKAIYWCTNTSTIVKDVKPINNSMNQFCFVYLWIHWQPQRQFSCLVRGLQCLKLKHTRFKFTILIDTIASCWMPNFQTLSYPGTFIIFILCSSWCLKNKRKISFHFNAFTQLSIGDDDDKSFFKFQFQTKQKI